MVVKAVEVVDIDFVVGCMAAAVGLMPSHHGWGTAELLVDSLHRNTIAVVHRHQKSNCRSNNFLHHPKDRSGCLGISSKLGHALVREVHTWHLSGYTCSIIFPQAYGHNNERQWRAWHEDRVMCHVCSWSRHMSEQALGAAFQCFHIVLGSEVRAKWYPVPDVANDLQVLKTS